MRLEYRQKKIMPNNPAKTGTKRFFIEFYPHALNHLLHSILRTIPTKGCKNNQFVRHRPINIVAIRLLIVNFFVFNLAWPFG
jgi:hypothetical protein